MDGVLVVLLDKRRQEVVGPGEGIILERDPEEGAGVVPLADLEMGPEGLRGGGKRNLADQDTLPDVVVVVTGRAEDDGRRPETQGVAEGDGGRLGLGTQRFDVQEPVFFRGDFQLELFHRPLFPGEVETDRSLVVQFDVPQLVMDGVVDIQVQRLHGGSDEML